MINIRKLNILLSYFMMVLLAIPIFKAPFWGSSYALIMAAIIGLWLITAIMIDSKAVCSNSLQLQVWLLIVFYIVCAVLNLGTIKCVLISITTPWCPMIIFLFYMKRRDYTGFKIIVKWAFVTLALTMVTTLYGLATNSYLSRVFGTLDVASRRSYMFQNVGDISFIYVAGLLFVLMASLLFTINEHIARKERNILLIVAISCFALAILGSSGITLMSVAVSSIIIMLYAVKNQRIRIVLIIMVITVSVIVYASGALREFFVQLSRESSNVYLSSKFSSIADSLSTGSATGDLGARLDRYANDWNLFINSFGFGIGPYYGGTGNVTSIYVADHSQLFADLARYGIIFLAYILILHKRFIRIMKELEDYCGIHYSIAPIVVCYAIMYCSQPIMSQPIMGYFVFIVWPGLPLLLSHRIPSKKNAYIHNDDH